MHAKNIDGDQGARMQQGLDAMETPCNVYHVGLKTNLHISLDPINPDFDIVPTGSAINQCQNDRDCYAKEAPAERLQSLRALAFDSGEKLIASLGPACMAQLKRRHVGLNGITLPENIVALIKRGKHGDESLRYCVHLSGHWRLSPRLDSMLGAAFPIAYKRFVSPPDVHPSTTKYWTPFAADAAFGAEHDCWSIAWQGCSQASPPAEEDVMDTTIRWAMPPH